MWPHRIVKAQILLNDLYRPHFFEEVAEMVSPEVAARLNPRQRYGIWWYNRRNVKKRHASEPDGKGGRRYAARTTTETRDREDWIAVPVLASECLPRDVVDRARHLVASREGNERLRSARAWELKGVARCSCGQVMITHTTHARTARPYNYYRCKRETAYGPDACPQKGIRAEKVEHAVWEFVSGLMKDPARLCAGLDEMIEQERAGDRPISEQERRTWLEKIADADRKRGAYQDQQAAGLMTLDELRAKIAALDEAREIARLELAALATRQQRLEELENDRDALMGRYAAMVPEALDQLTGEERSTLYRMLRLQAVPTPGASRSPGLFALSDPPVPVEEGGGGFQVRSQALPEHVGRGVRLARYDLSDVEDILFGDNSGPFLRKPDREGPDLRTDHDNHEGARCEPIGNLLLVSANRSFRKTTPTARSGAPGR